MDLDSMKYAELRSLAKQLGLKANRKADNLLKAIKRHYQQEKQEKEQEKNAEKEEENADECEAEVCISSVFVNTRRGKGARTKPRICETAADATEQPIEDQGASKAVASSPLCGGRDAKKRRVSAGSDSEEMANEMAATSSECPSVKDDAPVQCTGDPPNVVKGSKIPRYKGLQAKKSSLKPVTHADFRKLHKGHFNKMGSIDYYVQHKTKQRSKELTMLSDKTKLQRVDGKSQVKGKRSCPSMFSPASENKRPDEDRRRVTVQSAGKGPQNKIGGKEDALLRPSVFSTRRLNVGFSEAIRDTEHKKSLVKTPACVSSSVASSTPKKYTGNGAKPRNNKSALKSSGTFVFTGKTSVTPGTQNKPVFHLKASLSRPLTYKPHTGKLNPFGEAKNHCTGSVTRRTLQEMSLVSSSH